MTVAVPHALGRSGVARDGDLVLFRRQIGDGQRRGSARVSVDRDARARRIGRNSHHAEERSGLATLHVEVLGDVGAGGDRQRHDALLASGPDGDRVRAGLHRQRQRCRAAALSIDEHLGHGGTRIDCQGAGLRLLGRLANGEATKHDQRERRQQDDDCRDQDQSSEPRWCRLSQSWCRHRRDIRNHDRLRQRPFERERE